MPNELEPIVDQWYAHRDKGQPFVIVAVEEDGVEIQHYDGDVEVVDLEVWPTLDIVTSEPPEDWTGPVDDVEPDDLDYSETAMQGQSWTERSREYGRPVEDWSNDPEAREEEPEDEEDAPEQGN